MAYRFVAPLLDDPQSPAVPGLTLVPEVRAASVLDPAACREAADLVIAAHEAGQSWPSRTRYTDAARWDVNQQFRRSKNLPPQLQGLERAFEAMHEGAVRAGRLFGLHDGAQRLRRVDEQCLVYQEGDWISDHADDSALGPGADGGEVWHVIKPERHVVAVMWLTTQTESGLGRHEFSGGSLRFNSLLDEASGAPLDFHPAAGDMVLFPASPWYRHEVLPVRAGTRIALTRWYQVLAPQPAAAAG